MLPNITPKTFVYGPYEVVELKDLSPIFYVLSLDCILHNRFRKEGLFSHHLVITKRRLSEPMLTEPPMFPKLP